MDLKTVIVRNLAASWTSRFIGIITTAIITPILLDSLGKYEYGMWMAIGQGAALLSLLDFGIANSVALFVSRALGQSDDDEVRRVFSTALAVFSLVALVALVVVVSLWPVIPDLFNIQESYRSTAVLLFLIAGVNVVVIFPLRVGRGLLQSRNRYDIVFFLGIVSNLAKLVLVLGCFAWRSAGVVILAILMLGLSLFVETTVLVIALQQNPSARFGFSSVNGATFRKLLSFGLSALMKTFSGALFTKGQTVAVGIILGMTASALYAIPLMVIRKSGAFISGLGGTFIPIAGRMDSAGRRGDLSKLNMLGVRYGLALSIPVGVYLLFYGRAFLEVWLKNGVGDEGFVAMSRVLALMSVPSALGWPHKASSSILRGTGKHWLFATFLVCSSIIGFGVSIAAMKWTRLGILGAGVGWALKSCMVDVLALPVLITRHLRISIWCYLKTVYVPPLFTGIVLSALCGGMENFFPGNGLLHLMVVSGVYLCASAVLAFTFVLSREHRMYILCMVQRRFALVLS